MEVGEYADHVMTKWNKLYVHEIGLDKAAVEDMKAGNAAPREEVAVMVPRVGRRQGSADHILEREGAPGHFPASAREEDCGSHGDSCWRRCRLYCRNAFEHTECIARYATNSPGLGPRQLVLRCGDLGQDIGSSWC